MGRLLFVRNRRRPFTGRVITTGPERSCGRPYWGICSLSWAGRGLTAEDGELQFDAAVRAVVESWRGADELLVDPANIPDARSGVGAQVRRIRAVVALPDVVVLTALRRDQPRVADQPADLPLVELVGCPRGADDVLLH